MPVSASNRRWTIDDEERDCEYVIRVDCELDPSDPGDSRTPAYEGGVRLAAVVVTAVHHLDDAGEVGKIETGEAVRQFDERAWQLLEADPVLKREIDAAFAAERRAPQRPVRDGSGAPIPTPAQHVARKLQERKNNARRSG